ncbi:hypothetical protein [Streptomyces alkaliphilus]|nr:hypothetical protein [Streptomyces alkaliphilus]
MIASGDRPGNVAASQLTLRSIASRSNGSAVEDSCGSTTNP